MNPTEPSMPTRFVSSVDIRLNWRPRHVSVYVIRVCRGRPVALPAGSPAPHSFQFALVPYQHTQDASHNDQRKETVTTGQFDTTGPRREKASEPSVTILSYGGLGRRRGSGTLSPSEARLEASTGMSKCPVVPTHPTSRTSYLSTSAASISALLSAARQELFQPGAGSSPRDDQSRVADPCSDSGLATDVSLSESLVSDYWSGPEGMTPVTPRSWSGSAWGSGRGEEPLELTLWDVDSSLPATSPLYSQVGLSRRGGITSRPRRRVSIC